MDFTMSAKHFRTIKNELVFIYPEKIIEAHGINNNQSLVMNITGGKVILNHPFEEIQYFLVDEATGNKEWIYLTGICGKISMIDPKHIEKIKYANKTQCELIFHNMRKLFVNINADELKQRLHMLDDDNKEVI